MGILRFLKPDVEKMIAKGDIKGLVNALGYNDEDIRGKAAAALARYGDPAVEGIITALKEAAIALIRKDPYKAYSAAAACEVILKKQPLITALLAIGKPAVGPLLDAFNKEVPTVKGIIAIVLGKIKDPRAVEPLSAALCHSISHVRECAAFALGEIKDFRAVGPLIDLMCSCDPDLGGKAAADALVEIVGERFKGDRDKKWEWHDWWEQNKKNFLQE